MQIIPADSLNIFASWLKVLSPRLNFSYLCSVKKVTSVKKQLSLTITNLKTMKKFILTMVALLSMTMAQAQDNNTKCDGKKCEMKKQDPADRMAKELSLTDAQKTQLAELDKEYDAKLKKILNDEQYKKYKQMRKHHGRPGRRGHGGPRGPRPEMPPTD